MRPSDKFQRFVVESLRIYGNSRDGGVRHHIEDFFRERVGTSRLDGKLLCLEIAKLNKAFEHWDGNRRRRTSAEIHGSDLEIVLVYDVFYNTYLVFQRFNVTFKVFSELFH